jgi:hypothetical protein
LRKKEKEYSEEMRILELERETLLSSTSSHKEKIKYLESSLANCEQELRKTLDEKRNYCYCNISRLSEREDQRRRSTRPGLPANC